MFAALRLAFAFLTRLPVGEVGSGQFGAAMSWFPLVGVVLGAAQCGLYAVLIGRLDPALLAVLLVALQAGLTGALHLDGVADVFDGLSGARGDRTRLLEIMRDPRIGAHGATALSLLLLGKTLAARELCAAGQWLPLFAAPICARFAAVLLIRAFPYARSQGLGQAFREQSGARELVLAALVSLLALGWSGTQLIVPAAIALASAYGLAFWVARRAGGLTGDVYGAAIELAELAFYFGARAA